jgi:hypothetical protein
MNDALMIGVVLTLVFGSVIFYLYNRLMMTERKMNMFGNIITDLKIMMDSVPFSAEPPPVNMQEFEPIPEYLNAVSGPIPLQNDEIDGMSSEQEDYQQTLEQALESASVTKPIESKVLQISENNGATSLLSPAISVTKLSPELESMTVKELTNLVKQKGLTVPNGTRRKELIDILKKATELSVLDGPTPLNEGSPLDGSLPEVSL